MKLAFVLGTRPEIIKLSSVIRECVMRKIEFIIIHTNQHYSANMDGIFFKELELPQPHFNLGISGEYLHGRMTGKMLEKIEEVLLKEKPNLIIVQGDTNTALAGALTAAKLQIPVAHVEAGLRSYDRTMPEEINRVLTDHVSSFLFAPTNKQKQILLEEGIERKKIFVTGNTIVDAVFQNFEIAKKKNIKFPTGPYILLTMHRPSNVDGRGILQKQVSNLATLAEATGLPIIFPIHPRTKKQLHNFNIKINSNKIKLIEPVGYLEMLMLEKHAKLIITDSGGLQEEGCILKIPCITIRDNTERPETIDVGSNMLVGSNKNLMLSAAEKMMKKKPQWLNPFGDGTAGKKILDILIHQHA